MNKYNTVLGQMTALVSRSRFEKLVKEHKTEHGAKGLRSWTQYVTMLFSQLTGQHGLRSMEQGMNNQRNLWYHMGITNTERDLPAAGRSETVNPVVCKRAQEFGFV
jgi:hypothetical protein